MLMGRIYKSASLVLVWLDLSSRMPGIIPNLEKMAQLPDASLPPLYHEAKDRKYYQELSDKLDLKSGATAFRNEAYIAAEMTQCLWFKRIWVLQELFLAKKAIFLYGGHQLSFAAMRKTIIWLYSNPAESSFYQPTFYSTVSSVLSPILTPHTVNFPFFLEACESVGQGRTLSLMEWVRACRGREAGDARDMLFGGLSLIDPECLGIDRYELQLDEHDIFDRPLPQLPPGPTTLDSSSHTAVETPETTTLLPKGLWANLEPDYQAAEPEVFINFAACLLSQQDKDNISTLLSLATRRLRWIDTMTSSGKCLFDAGIPSWAPALGVQISLGTRSDLLSAPVEVSGGGSTFAAATLGQSEASHPRPQMSADGRTLRLNVVAVDTVARIPSQETPRVLVGYEEYVTAFLDLLVSLPYTYQANGRPSFDVVATVLATCLPSTMNHSESSELLKKANAQGEATTPRDVLPSLWLFEALDKLAMDRAADLCQVIAKLELRKGGESLKTKREELNKLESLYSKLAQRHPNFPWTGLEEVISQQSGSISERPEDQKKQLSPEAEIFNSAIFSRVFDRTLFFTKDGLIGIGPEWLKLEDKVMLVQGARVPYLFRHISNAELKESIQKAEAELVEAEAKLDKSEKKDKGDANMKKTGGRPSALTWKYRKNVKDLRVMIEETRLRIGRDAWELVGEAYIEGIMHGEAIERAGSDAFERIFIV